MENPKKCSWKRIVDLLSNPEGLLRICNNNCDGYNYNCDNYTDSMKGVLSDDFCKYKSGLRKYFVKRDLYNRSKN